MMHSFYMISFGETNKQVITVHTSKHTQDFSLLLIIFLLLSTFSCLVKRLPCYIYHSGRTWLNTKITG